MCYINCPYETYPNGRNEGCICKKKKYDKCLLETDENIEYSDIILNEPEHFDE